MLEAIALDGRRSFLHFSYAYDEGFLTRNALKAYLATFGRGKVGFTVLGTQPDGAPYFIGGTRGLMERNAMRYFLAVEACLGAAGVDPAARAMVTQEAWFAGTEEYPPSIAQRSTCPPTLVRCQAQRRAAPGCDKVADFREGITHTRCQRRRAIHHTADGRVNEPGLTMEEAH